MECALILFTWASCKTVCLREIGKHCSRRGGNEIGGVDRISRGGNEIGGGDRSGRGGNEIGGVDRISRGGN